ncbi:restriction endonuclease subunit S [Providencia rettgeri]
MSNLLWPTVPLSSLTSRIGDGIHGTPAYSEYGNYPFINGNNLKNGLIEITDDTKRVDRKEYEKYFIRFDEKTLFLSINGTIGNLAKYRGEEIVLGKSAAYIKCTNINIDFLYYYFQLKEVRAHMWNVATGSTIKNLSLASIRELEIPKPPENVAKKIAGVFSAIDKKIELNNQINTKLEAMAKILYDYWFLQFNFPDSNGKPYKFAGGKMIYNPTLKRKIPDGWEESTIGEIEPNIITGKTPSKNNPEYFGGNIPFITIGDIRGNTYIVSTEETLTDKGAATQKNKFLPEDSICVTCIASPGLVGFVTTPAQTNQQINSLVCDNERNKYYLYFTIKSYFEGAKAKTGNTFANMNKGDFSSISILKPSNQVLQLYHQKAHPLFQQIKLKSLENQQLIQIRNWLLPMLMNGQVTIK